MNMDLRLVMFYRISGTIEYTVFIKFPGEGKFRVNE